VFDRATALYERAQNWVIGSDPGLLRLRMAARTTVSLAISLLILFLLTKATHQPLTVGLLGVLITMIAGRVVNEPDPYQQKITMVVLPLPATLAITTAVLLAPHKLIADVVFVVVVYAAVMPAADFLDAAETFAMEHHEGSERSTSARLLAIVHALRQIDRAVVSAAIDLGVEDVVAAAARTSRAG
jgi:hypothetical protein